MRGVSFLIGAILFLMFFGEIENSKSGPELFANLFFLLLSVAIMFWGVVKNQGES